MNYSQNEIMLIAAVIGIMCVIIGSIVALRHKYPEKNTTVKTSPGVIIMLIPIGAIIITAMLAGLVQIITYITAATTLIDTLSGILTLGTMFCIIIGIIILVAANKETDIIKKSDKRLTGFLTMAIPIIVTTIILAIVSGK